MKKLLIAAVITVLGAFLSFRMGMERHIVVAIFFAAIALTFLGALKLITDRAKERKKARKSGHFIDIDKR